jgi:hypothetical protein
VAAGAVVAAGPVDGAVDGAVLAAPPPHAPTTIAATASRDANRVLVFIGCWYSSNDWCLDEVPARPW